MDRTRLFEAAFAIAAFGSAGCRNWDFYDPRLGSTSSGATTTGSGGSATVSSSSATTGSTATTSSQSSTSVSATGTSTSSSSSTGTPLHCGGTSLITDDFPGSDLAENWNPVQGGGATVMETGNELVVTLPSGSASSSFGAYDSNRYYDLTSDSVSVEVTNAGNTVTSAYCVLSVSPAGGGGNFVQLLQSGGQLKAVKNVGGMYTTLKSAPYDSVSELYWRIRENAGTTFFETSGDGTTFTPYAQAADSSLFPMDLVLVQIGGGTNGGEINPGSLHFAKLNGGGAPTGKWCPASSITDDFMSSTRGPIWSRSYVSAPETMTQGGGTLVFTLAANASKYGAYGSSTSYDLTGSQVLVHVPVTPPTTVGAQAYLNLDGLGKNSLQMIAEQTNLTMRINLAGVASDASILFDPVQFAWWRIRESGGTVYWETAPDGKTWTIQRMAADPFALTELDIELGAGTYQSTAVPGTAQYSSFNIAPP